MDAPVPQEERRLDGEIAHENLATSSRLLICRKSMCDADTETGGDR